MGVVKKGELRWSLCAQAMTRHRDKGDAADVSGILQAEAWLWAPVG